MTADAQVIALVPAAGEARRMGAGRSKIFLDIGGRTLIEHTLSALAAGGRISDFIVLARPEDIEALGRLNLPRSPHLVPGGATRQQSVWNGLCYIKEHVLSRLESTYVLVHDAARCFVSRGLIDRIIAAALDTGAVTAARPVPDTLVRAARGIAAEGVDRSGLWAVQTPQMFLFGLLYEAHLRAAGEATDDATLVRALHNVQIVPGEAANFKITAPDDYELAKRLLGVRRDNE